MLTDIQSFHWSGTKFDSADAWLFFFFGGHQSLLIVNSPLVGWAVRPGDAAAVPEPSSLLLIGVGMLGLVWHIRRQR